MKNNKKSFTDGEPDIDQAESAGSAMAENQGNEGESNIDIAESDGSAMSTKSEQNQPSQPKPSSAKNMKDGKSNKKE
jgi:hypothetical protein